MMVTWGETLKRRWRAEGYAEGRAEGCASMFIRMAEVRFGPLSADQRACIQAVDITEFDAWIDRLIEASSLEALFIPPT